MADLGHCSNIGDWIDRHVGTGGGVIDEYQVSRYVDQYGADPAHHPAIRALALHLGYITLETNGRIMLPQAMPNGSVSVNVNGQQLSLGPITIQIGGGTPVTIANATPPPPDSKEIARRLISAGGSGRQSDIELAVAELAHVPPPLLEMLERRGVRVYVCRDNITDHHPDLKGLHARGAPPYVTNEVVDGFYGRRTGIVVATTLEKGRRVLRAGALLKEVGRALDDLAGNLSKTRVFRRGYEADIPELKKNDEVFLTQEGDVGAEEAFAQSFAWFAAHRRYLSSHYDGLSNFWECEEGRGWNRFV